MWVVYLLLCESDNSIYCGITNNFEKRLLAHRSGKGAKYTRGRGPISVLKIIEVENKSQALKLEYKIKRLSKNDKLKLCI